MTEPTPIQTTYDADSDVLYLTSYSAIATRGVEDENGFVWRTGADGALVGLTVLDYRERWTGNPSLLLRDVALAHDVGGPEAERGRDDVGVDVAEDAAAPEHVGLALGEPVVLREHRSPAGDHEAAAERGVATVSSEELAAAREPSALIGSAVVEPEP